MATICHSLHPLDRVAKLTMRVMAKFSRESPMGPEARGQFDETIENTPAAEVGDVSGWWCRPDVAATNAAVLYFHGRRLCARFGAGLSASRRPDCHAGASSRLRTGVQFSHRAAIPDPGDEARAAYRGLVEQGFANSAWTN